MEVKFKDSSPEKIKTDLLALPAKENEVGPVIRRLDRFLRGKFSERVRKSKFTGAEGSTLLYPSAGRTPASHVLLIGMGKEREIEGDTWRKAAARARKEASSIGAADIAFSLFPDEEPESAVRAIIEGIGLASYQFNKYGR
jgi:leucyl aminopeptidase